MKQYEEGRGETRTEKEAWTRPTFARMRAGEAELGANPVIGEGFFGKGS